MRRLSLLSFVVLMMLALAIPSTAFADGGNDDDRRHEDEKKDDEKRHDDEKKDDDQRHDDEKKDDEKRDDNDARHDDKKDDNDHDRDANEAPEPWLPEGMHGFCGVLRGRVLKVFEHGVLIKVERVARWRNNRAENPRAAIGKELLINVGWVKDGGKWHPNRRHMIFIHMLRRGMRVDLDCKNDEGNRLHLQELNNEQRRAVEREQQQREREERERRARENHDDDNKDDDERRDDNGGNDRRPDRRPDRRR